MRRSTDDKQPQSGAGSGNGTHGHQVDRQLARLFGESLFGPWLDPARLMEAGGKARRRGSWRRRLLVLALAGLVVGIGVWLTRRGFSRQAAEDRAHIAKDVSAFLADGELERLAQFLDLLAPAGVPLQANDPYLDLVVQAEAALYRHHDALPERLARIEPYFADASSSPKRFLARLTVASNAERAPWATALAALEASLGSSSEYWAIVASIQDDDVAKARSSWKRSLDLGPLWLPHRYEQCLFEARHDNPTGVAQVARHMVKVAPGSPWTWLALQLPGAERGAPAPSTGSAPPVAQYHEHLAVVFDSLRTGGSPAASRQALERAFAAASDQPPFVLDVFGWLLAAKARDLAEALTAFEAWPHGSPVAAVLATRLQATPERMAPTGTRARAAATIKSAAGGKPAHVAKKKAGKARHRGHARR